LTDAYYKFLDAADVDRVLKDGTVRISSFKYFRELEEKEWGLIADRLEGAAEMTTPKIFVLTENSRELDLMNNAGFMAGNIGKFANISGGGLISIGGAKFVHLVPGHIYCASYGEFEALKRYHTEEAEHKYNACLRIRDFEGLLDRIFRTGMISETHAKFLDLFDRYNIGRVEYEPRSRSVEDGKMLDASPMKKALVFKPQSEARIHFVPVEGQTAADRLIVKIDDPGSLFEQVAM
jgi:hypothetical protein